MSAAAEPSKAETNRRAASSAATEHRSLERTRHALCLSGQERKAMQSVVALSKLEVVARSTARRSSGTRTLFQALRRIVHLDFFSFEDEMDRAIDRAFAEFAREMRK